MRVELWTGDVTDELVEAFERLTPQLSTSNPPPTREQLHEIVESPACHLFVARDDDGTIVGTSTLVSFRIPTGVRGWVEDVVVDADRVRGRGLRVGERLTLAMIDQARALGCVTLDLTSRPSRRHANDLYARVGFERRDTNVWRRTLES